MIESELFGYEKGAFTGALSNGKQGLFVQGHQGTVFLDEVSEMPLSVQARFLRVLQEHEVMPVGSLKVIPVDIRVIAATNKDLKAMVEQKKIPRGPLLSNQRTYHASSLAEGTWG